MTMDSIEIPVRELHARTGHYVRRAAARRRVVITDRGRRIAEIIPWDSSAEASAPWARRFEEAPPITLRHEGIDSTVVVSEDRDRG